MKNVTFFIASSEQYFKAGVLKERSDISEGIGLPDAAQSGCLLLTWLVIFVSLCRGGEHGTVEERNVSSKLLPGVQSSGKVAYFTALFPYLVLAVLLVRGLTLPGAAAGLAFFFAPQWERLLEAGVWYAAVTQSFFSLGVGFGVIITYSSYNRFILLIVTVDGRHILTMSRFRHDSYRDALVISAADTLTSVLAGAVIFSILGHLSHELGRPVQEVVKSGAGLAFVSYPEVAQCFRGQKNG